MAAKHNQNASGKRPKTSDDDNEDSTCWMDMLAEILVLIIIRLGIVDFISFSGACKEWRKIALANRKMFMLSRQRMSISISTCVAKRKECWLEEPEGRRFRTILPRSSGTTCVGIASGYLILFGRKTSDFKLVNPITRHELHFPNFPFRVIPEPLAFRGILAFSQTMSRWVFVISPRFSRIVSISYSGNAANWSHLCSDQDITDLVFFKRRIYTLNRDIGLCQVRFVPQPTLIPLIMNNPVTSHMRLLPGFATSGEKLFVMSNAPSHPYAGAVEADLDEMNWVVGEPLQLELWEEPHMHKDPYPRNRYINRTNKNKNKKTYVRNMWYLPHKCLDANILDE